MEEVRGSRSSHGGGLDQLGCRGRGELAVLVLGLSVDRRDVCPLSKMSKFCRVFYSGDKKI